MKFSTLVIYSFKAGIKERLIIALEPEAASIYCQHLTKEDLTKDDHKQTSSVLGQLSVGDKYMVVDLGGEFLIAASMHM